MNRTVEKRELQDGLYYYSIPDLKNFGLEIDDMPLSYKIIAESLLRNIPTGKTSLEDITTLLSKDKRGRDGNDIPFYVTRLVMHDLGLGNLIDLASFREEAFKQGIEPSRINPMLPVDIIIDHSVAVDYSGTPESYMKNLKTEFERNKERYEYIKWFSRAFKNVRVLPPSLGITHQINLEYISTLVGIREIDGVKVAVPDTLVGMDSHTPMINGLGVLGWGVGGIEGMGVMLGEPVPLNPPVVIGVKLTGKLRKGIVATDIVLTLTEKLRSRKVVGKFIEFFGPSVGELSVFDRATISNMCPEYGATVGLFPIDDRTIEFLKITGRDSELIKLVQKYYEAQGMFGSRTTASKFYEEVIDIDLSDIQPSIAGPNLPTKNLQLERLPESFLQLVGKGKDDVALSKSSSLGDIQTLSEDVPGGEVVEGDIVIASITSCTNTSNPRALLAAGLLARNAVNKGIRVNPKVKTSFSPGSRAVEKYLNDSGLQSYLDNLGFNVTGFGCMTCVGKGGPLNESVEEQILSKNINVASITSSNRNFEGRIHRNVKANYITSPSMVVALALSGSVIKNPANDCIGTDGEGNKVFLNEIIPTDEEIDDFMERYVTKETYKEVYEKISTFSPLWDSLETQESLLFKWNPASTFIRPSPFFDSPKGSSHECTKSVERARTIMVLGDNVTTDHISPEGYIPKDSPAGEYLKNLGVPENNLDTYGSRRGNPEVKVRGAFSNNRLKNKLVDIEGGYTKHFPSNNQLTIFEASRRYKEENTPLVVFGGMNYGMGSSRDWAAKGTSLLNIKAVIANSFERIHRENLVYMGILPLQYTDKNVTFESLDIDISKPLDIVLPEVFKPGSTVRMKYYNMDSLQKEIDLLARVDTKLEAAYYCSGGIMPYVLEMSSTLYSSESLTS